MNLNELYTQIITENSRSKENRHPVEGATHSLEGVNPSCGDDITLQLRVKDGKIEDAGFIGSGCAISQASASLMIDLVKGGRSRFAGHCPRPCPRQVRRAGLAHAGGSAGRRGKNR